MTKRKKEFSEIFRGTIIENGQRLLMLRKGILYLTLYDTINTLWQNTELKPLIRKAEPKEHEWFFLIHLPPTITFQEFKKYEQVFADHLKGAVLIKKQFSEVLMTVMVEPLKEEYSYEFDFTPYDKMYLPIPIGYYAGGFLVQDFARMINLLVAGHPESGKSNFLHNVAVSILLSRPVEMYIMDLKKGAEFNYLSGYAKVIGDEPQAITTLGHISNEIDRRLNLFKQHGVVKIEEYLELGHNMKFIILIIDELAEMADEVALKLLNRIVRLGRAPGVRCITSTQRPSSTMFKAWGDSKAMFPANMCFHVRDSINSNMVLDNDKASLIPNISGRAIFQWEHEFEVQAMYLPVKEAKKLLQGRVIHQSTCKTLNP